MFDILCACLDCLFAAKHLGAWFFLLRHCCALCRLHASVPCLTLVAILTTTVARLWRPSPCVYQIYFLRALQVAMSWRGNLWQFIDIRTHVILANFWSCISIYQGLICDKYWKKDMQTNSISNATNVLCGKQQIVNALRAWVLQNKSCDRIKQSHHCHVTMDCGCQSHLYLAHQWIRSKRVTLITSNTDLKWGSQCIWDQQQITKKCATKTFSSQERQVFLVPSAGSSDNDQIIFPYTDADQKTLQLWRNQWLIKYRKQCATVGLRRGTLCKHLTQW